MYTHVHPHVYGTYAQVIYKPASGAWLRGTVAAIENVVFSVEDKPKNLAFSDEDGGFAVMCSRCLVKGNAVAGSNKALCVSPGISIPPSNRLPLDCL